MPFADLREAECKLWEAFGRGFMVDLRSGDFDGDDPAGADNWDVSRRVRGEVVQALLLGAVEPIAGHVAGVRLAGALVEGSVNLRQGVVKFAAELKCCRFVGEVVLAEARTRSVDLSGSVMNALDVTSAEIDSLTLDCCQAQTVKSDLAHITGTLSMKDAHLVNPDDVAFSADGMTVGGDVFCDEGFWVEGETRLMGARIGGMLSLKGAHLANPRGSALTGDRVSVDGNIFCDAVSSDKRFYAEGETRLLGARIGGMLSLRCAHLSHPGKDAFSADGMTVGGDVFCDEGFQAVGAVRFPGAVVKGELNFRRAEFCCPGDLALRCDTAQADSLWLDGVKVTGTASFVATRVRILHDEGQGWPERMRLDGFTYEDLRPYVGATGPSGRLSWLEHAECDYRAQPYEQLAAFYRRLGHDEEARLVLVAKQRRRRAGLGLPGKVTGYVLDALVGYGYRPARAFAWLIALVVGGSLYFSVNRPHLLDPAQHPHYQPVLYAADLVIPIVSLGQADTWAPAGAAQWIAAALTALGWILATAVVAGITRVLTRN